MVTNKELNDRREPGCEAVLADKKYFKVGHWFMKRTLRKHEWQSVSGGLIRIPSTTYPQRWKTDAAILRYLLKETDIPLPLAECTFEDDGAFYLQTKFVEGVSMTELAPEEKEIVINELKQHVATLQSLRSDIPGVPGETLLCPPGPSAILEGEEDDVHRCRDWLMNSCDEVMLPQLGMGKMME